MHFFAGQWNVVASFKGKSCSHVKNCTVYGGGGGGGEGRNCFLLGCTSLTFFIRKICNTTIWLYGTMPRLDKRVQHAEHISSSMLASGFLKFSLMLILKCYISLFTSTNMERGCIDTALYILSWTLNTSLALLAYLFELWRPQSLWRMSWEREPAYLRRSMLNPQYCCAINRNTCRFLSMTVPWKCKLNLDTHIFRVVGCCGTKNISPWCSICL